MLIYRRTHARGLILKLTHYPIPRELDGTRESRMGQMPEESAHLSSNGSHLVAKGSCHDIQIDRPDAVVDAIRKVLGQAREAKQPGGIQE